jgi:hypothetical protein
MASFQRPDARARSASSLAHAAGSSLISLLAGIPSLWEKWLRAAIDGRLRPFSSALT